MENQPKKVIEDRERPSFSRYFEENEVNSCDEILKLIQSQFKYTNSTPDMQGDAMDSCEKVARFVALNFDMKCRIGKE